MSQSELSKKTGIRPNAINEMYHEMCERINIEYIDLICEALNCTIDELIEYIPNKVKRVGTDMVNKKNISSKMMN
jgi:putative transcriptional regulator